MSSQKRPPDILRKSHAHTSGDERARARRELEEALGEIDEADNGEGSEEAGGAARRRNRRRKPAAGRRGSGATHDD
jgi:hypothetical protein